MRTRSTHLGLAAAVVLAGGVAAVSAGSQAAQRPVGVVESCDTRSGFHFRSRPGDVVAGPLRLVGGAFTPASTVREFGGDKMPVIVAAGHRVTIELSRATRRGAGLGYGPLPEGRKVVVADAHRVVTFGACPRTKDSGSSIDGRPATFWSGMVHVDAPRCVPLRIWIDDEPEPRRRTLHMGRRRCA